jgi:hypothetical protein
MAAVAAAQAGSVSFPPALPTSLEQAEWLKLLSDADLQKVVNEKPQEFFFSPPGRELSCEWLESMPYERILQFCNAQTAQYLLAQLTPTQWLGDRSTCGAAKRAFRAMNQLDRLEVFAQAVALNRTAHPSFNVADLLLRHHDPSHFVPFHKGLPVHVQAILEIEHEPVNLYLATGNHDAAFQERHAQMKAGRDAKIQEYVQKVKAEQRELAPEGLDPSQKV